MSFFLLLKIIFICTLIHNSTSLEEVLVSTPLGQLRGQVLTSRGGQRYNAFVGIPFSEKVERFEMAKPVEPWEGIRDALNYSAMCPQIIAYAGMEFLMGEEDCLYINVFYPHSERCLTEDGVPLKKLPVYFFIYGGSFNSGSGDLYAPTFIMDQCVTYVSFNYRLGALGFLTTEDGLIPGNNGLKDQLLALKWTQNNIQSFRGDPSKVTIAGQSAGGASIGHLLVSPAAKGLFAQAIEQSGSVLNKFALIKNPGQNSAILGQNLNCTGNSTVQLKECLLAASFEDIVKLQEKGKIWFNDPLLWGPVIELPNATNPFQTRDPYVLLRDGEFNKVPLISGIVLEEGILVRAGEIILNPAALNDLNTNWHTYAPIAFFYHDLNLTEEVVHGISDKIREFYFANLTIGNETFDELSHLYSDRFFNYGIYKNAQIYSKYAPLYHYVFTYKGLFSFIMPTLGFTQPGSVKLWTCSVNRFGHVRLCTPGTVVSHTDENQYLFEMPTVPLHVPGSEQEIMSQNLVNLWTSFVINGEPLETWTENVQWPANENTNSNVTLLTLQLDKEIKLLSNYLAPRMEFWDQLDELSSVEFSK